MASFYSSKLSPFAYFKTISFCSHIVFSITVPHIYIRNKDYSYIVTHQIIILFAQRPYRLDSSKNISFRWKIVFTISDPHACILNKRQWLLIVFVISDNGCNLIIKCYLQNKRLWLLFSSTMAPNFLIKQYLPSLKQPYLFFQCCILVFGITTMTTMVLIKECILSLKDNIYYSSAVCLYSKY